MRSKLEPQTILVTGAGGFIGSAVVRALHEKGHEKDAGLGCGQGPGPELGTELGPELGRGPGRGLGLRALLAAPGQTALEVPADVLCAWADIGDQDALLELAAGADVVVHLAGLPSVAGSFQTPGDYVRVHMGGTAAVLEACRRTGVKRLVYVSSAEVYGRAGDRPVDEDRPPAARSPYAAAKVGAEQLVQCYVHAFGLEAVVLRPFSVYGPGLPRRSLLGTLLHQACHDEAIVLADLSPVRDYCYVDDVAEAVAAACVASLPAFSVLNLGSGRGISVAELARQALAVVGRDLPIREAPHSRRPGNADILELVAATARAERLLNWRATTPLAAGLARTLAWLDGCGD